MAGRKKPGRSPFKCRSSARSRAAVPEAEAEGGVERDGSPDDEQWRMYCECGFVGFWGTMADARADLQIHRAITKAIVGDRGIDYRCEDTNVDETLQRLSLTRGPS